MVAIRLRRAGSKKRPFFRIVVADSRGACDSSFVEILGHYNPRTKPAVVKVDAERVQYWLQHGAQPSDSVRTLLARHLTPVPVQPPVAAPVAGRGCRRASRAGCRSGRRGAERVHAGGCRAGGGRGAGSMSVVRDVVEVLARALTDKPDLVQVVESKHKGTTLVELFVGPGELGKVIGKQGRTAAALRTLAATAAEKEGSTVTLEIRDGRP